MVPDEKGLRLRKSFVVQQAKLWPLKHLVPLVLISEWLLARFLPDLFKLIDYASPGALVS